MLGDFFTTWILFQIVLLCYDIYSLLNVVPTELLFLRSKYIVNLI